MGAVVDHHMTVILSSHLIADMERVCDYLVILQNGHIQVNGDVDHLLGSHKILVGPSGKGLPPAGVQTVVQGSTKGRQDTLVVQSDGPIRDPSWIANDVTLEDLVLAYLSEPTVSTLSGPGFDHEEVDA
jgi:ABC-2 type transport system ATP-binding protein